MGRDDLHAEMPRNGLDDATADRLLAGALDPEDAPPGYAQLAVLVAAARRTPGTRALVGRDHAVSAITAAIGATPGTSSVALQRRSRRMISKLLTLKALGIALPAMALTAGSAAAATGSLPAPAQSVVSNALSNVGVHVPNGHDKTAGSKNGPSSTPPAQAVGPNASGPAKHGLCRAATANHGHASPRSVAFRNLQNAATAAHETVTQYCATVTHTSGNTGASSDTNGASGSGSSDTESGSAPKGPPSSTPRRGGPPASTPVGPPSSTPGNGSPHVSTRIGPPSSVPPKKGH